MMHPASDCFQGLGYSVKAARRAIVIRAARCGPSFAATKGDERLLVYERINSDAGETWTDVSAWYWSALRQQGKRLWWAITVAENSTEIYYVPPMKKLVSVTLLLLLATSVSAQTAPTPPSSRNF
jgi:hypothetical protein